MTFNIHLELDEIEDLIIEYLKNKGFEVLDTEYRVCDNRFYEAISKVKIIGEEDNDQPRI